MTDRVTGWMAALAGAGALLAAMTTLGAPSAQAQGVEAPQQARVVPPAFAPTEAAGSFDRETLDAFARATRIVGALRNEYMPKIAAANIAGRPDRAEALFDEMRARMHDAIDATGLTIERYEAIAARAEHDRALRARIEAIMTGARPSADPGLGVEAPQSAPPCCARWPAWAMPSRRRRRRSRRLAPICPRRPHLTWCRSRGWRPARFL
ncbi:MAG: DUF4168 domain-containing protein [Alphaproteobacteria bacterium]